MNDFTSGLPLTFERFSALAGLEPGEIAQLAPRAGSGERPLRGWVQWMTDVLGPRETRPPLDLAPAGPPGETGPRGVGIQALGRDEDGYLIAVLTDDSVHDLGLIDGTVPGGDSAARRRTVGELTAAGLSDGARVTLREYHAGTGLGGGELVWRAGSSAAPDGGGVFAASDQAAGRFFRTAHLLGTFTPEDFGAVGDGEHDDYPAFMALARAMSSKGSGTLNLRPKATYRYRQWLDDTRPGPANPWQDIPIWRNMNGLRIHGNGATLRNAGGFHRSKGYLYVQDPFGRNGFFSSQDAIALMTVAYSKNVQIHDLTLDGMARTTTRAGIPPTGYTTDTGYPMGGEYVVEGYGPNFQAWGVDGLLLSNVESRDSLQDGFCLSYSEVYGPDGVTRVTPQTRTLCHNVTMLGCRTRYNRRQALSVVGARDVVALGCDFSYTGIVGVNPDGTYQHDAYGWHTPGLGVDIEPSVPLVNPNEPGYTVLEYTGNFSMIGGRIADNINGPISCLYSDKINGGVLFQNVLIDGERATGHDSGIAAAAGVTFRDCDIRLPKGGFLWMDVTKPEKTVKAHLGCHIYGGKIKIKDTLGYFNPRPGRGIPLTIDGVELTYPALPDAEPPIQLLDRADGVNDRGSLRQVRFTNNTVLVPYAFGSASASGALVAMVEGVGQWGGNTWRLTGARPDVPAGEAFWLVLYRTDLGGGVQAHRMMPYSERFISETGQDWLYSTPDGNKTAPMYSWSPPPPRRLTRTTIPFGYYGPAPLGKTTLTFGRFSGKGTLVGINAGFESFVAAGQTVTINVYHGDGLVATATVPPGTLSAVAQSGFPYTPYDTADNLALRVELELAGTGALPLDFSGYLAVEELV